jgi:arginyl-tRNA synthetase
VNRAELSAALVAAVGAAVADGELGVRIPDEAPLTWGKAGIVRSPLALRLAGEAGLAAREVAEIIAGRLGAGVEVSGDGFLNFAGSAGAVVAEILARGDGYGRMAGVPQGSGWPEWPRTFENPGFRVRFAYARAVAVRRRAAEVNGGLRGPVAEGWRGGECAEEVRLADALAEFPGRVELAVRKRSAGPLERHMERIAEAFHDVYERCPALPVGDERPDGRHVARVRLAAATETTLKNGLSMLGENPRERL